MDFSPTPTQQKLIDRAAALARESMAPRASHYDQTGDYPRESWCDSWQQGFLAMAVPKALLNIRDDVLLARHAGRRVGGSA